MIYLVLILIGAVFSAIAYLRSKNKKLKRIVEEQEKEISSYKVQEKVEVEAQKTREEIKVKSDKIRKETESISESIPKEESKELSDNEKIVINDIVDRFNSN